MGTNFDERAATWDDDPAKVARAQVVARAVRDTLQLDPSLRMLEYGAGTGLVTQFLHDDVGPVTLVDTSAGMRDVIKKKIAAGTIADARVWDVDFATDAVPDEQFDLVLTVMALHHIPNLEPVLTAFAKLLPAGGHLGIVDLEEEDGSFHPEGFDGHHGFNRAALATSLSHAGFADVTFQHCHNLVRDGVTYPIFLATCVRS